MVVTPAGDIELRFKGGCLCRSGKAHLRLHNARRTDPQKQWMDVVHEQNSQEQSWKLNIIIDQGCPMQMCYCTSWPQTSIQSIPKCRKEKRLWNCLYKICAVVSFIPGARTSAKNLLTLDQPSLSTITNHRFLAHCQFLSCLLALFSQFFHMFCQVRNVPHGLDRQMATPICNTKAENRWTFGGGAYHFQKQIRSDTDTCGILFLCILINNQEINM